MDDESVSSGGGSGEMATSAMTSTSSNADLVLIRIAVPDLNDEKCLQFNKDEVIWEVKQQALAAMPKVSLTI